MQGHQLSQQQSSADGTVHNLSYGMLLKICVPNNWMAVLTFVSPYEPNQTYTQPFPFYVQCLRVFAHTYHKEGEGRPLKAVARSLATSGVNGEIEEGSGEKSHYPIGRFGHY